MTTTKPKREEVEQLVGMMAPGYGLDPELILKQIQAESSFDQGALSPCKARGLMQLTPICVTDLKQRFGMQVDADNWKENVAGGMCFMSFLKGHFGSYELALAAYNYGEGNVKKILTEYGVAWKERLPKETSDYLTKILG